MGRGSPLRAGAAVGIAAFAALVLLRLVDDGWREGIERNRAQREVREVRSVLGVRGAALKVARMDAPAFLEALVQLDPQVQAWQLSDGGAPAAVAVALAVEGYSGTIRLVVGVDSDLTITGVRTIEHRETPGIGDFIGRAGHPWMAAMGGLAPGAGAEPDAVAGATVTSGAVTGAAAAVLAAVAARPPFGPDR